MLAGQDTSTRAPPVARIHPSTVRASGTKSLGATSRKFTRWRVKAHTKTTRAVSVEDTVKECTDAIKSITTKLNQIRFPLDLQTSNAPFLTIQPFHTSPQRPQQNNFRLETGSWLSIISVPALEIPDESQALLQTIDEALGHFTDVTQHNYETAPPDNDTIISQVCQFLTHQTHLTEPHQFDQLLIQSSANSAAVIDQVDTSLASSRIVWLEQPTEYPGDGHLYFETAPSDNDMIISQVCQFLTHQTHLTEPHQLDRLVIQSSADTSAVIDQVDISLASSRIVWLDQPAEYPGDGHLFASDRGQELLVGITDLLSEAVSSQPRQEEPEQASFMAHRTFEIETENTFSQGTPEVKGPASTSQVGRLRNISLQRRGQLLSPALEPPPEYGKSASEIQGLNSQRQMLSSVNPSTGNDSRTDEKYQTANQPVKPINLMQKVLKIADSPSQNEVSDFSQGKVMLKRSQIEFVPKEVQAQNLSPLKEASRLQRRHDSVNQSARVEAEIQAAQNLRPVMPVTPGALSSMSRRSSLGKHFLPNAQELKNDVNATFKSELKNVQDLLRSSQFEDMEATRQLSQDLRTTLRMAKHRVHEMRQNTIEEPSTENGPFN